MEIRRAEARDIDGLNRLLRQVLEVHHKGRPDLFKGGVKKYTDGELTQMISDDSKPIFAAFENGELLGYAFCVIKQYPCDNILTDIKTLYIDDLCVDENSRGKHIGTALYEYVKGYAKSIGCYNITLNVWECNPSAKRFYEHLGLLPQKTGMEMLL